MNTRVLKSDALLLLAATVWGFAFVAQRAGMSHVGPFTFNAVRFALGAAVLFPIVLARRGSKRERPRAPVTGAARQLLYAGGLAGSVLFAGASLQQAGLVYTTASKAGFITGLYVVIVPLIGLLTRLHPGLGAWIGAAFAAAGLYLLSITGRFEISPGDGLVLGSALFFAVHVIVIGWLSVRMDAMLLAITQYSACSALSWIAAAAFESIDVHRILAASLPILYTGLLSVGLAYTLQVIAQREAPPAHAALILSLEAVFAALGGYLFLGESLSSRSLAGCGLMLAGALISKLGSDERTPAAMA